LPRPQLDEDNDDEATIVGAVPADLLAQATGALAPVSDQSEWVDVFDEFIRTKASCGESTDGLTFEKFARTLKKNRDSLIERHACKRVKFIVYVKDGHASLKASPVKD
jgi:hypothetical protein